MNSTWLVPEIVGLFTSHIDPNLVEALIWFQQDEAAPHYLRDVNQFIDTALPNYWIPLRKAIECPAMLPNLTLL